MRKHLLSLQLPGIIQNESPYSHKTLSGYQKETTQNKIRDNSTIKTKQK